MIAVRAAASHTSVHSGIPRLARSLSWVLRHNPWVIPEVNQVATHPTISFAGFIASPCNSFTPVCEAAFGVLGVLELSGWFMGCETK